MATNQTFTPLPCAVPAMQSVVDDLYSKIAALLSRPASSTPASSSSSTTITTTEIIATSIAGSTGQATNPQYAFIPALTAIPSNNPTLGAPYAQNGLVIEFAPLTGDSGVLFQYTGNPAYAWAYMDGVFYRTQSQLTGLASLLSGVHANLLVWVTDYNHMLQWTGSAWQRGPGDLEHSDTFHSFGAVPTDIGWHDCDGTIGVNYLNYDGTLGTRTLPNLTTAAYAKSTKATYSATEVIPTAPTLAMNSYTPAGSVAAGGGITGASTTGASVSTASANIDAGTGASSTFLISASLSDPGHVHSVPSGGSFTGTPATLTGTISLPGDPVENFSLIVYYRQ